MKIVYLHQYFTTPDMPGGTRSYEMAKRLVEWGHEVHVVTSWRNDDSKRGWFSENVDGITVHWLPVPYSNKMGVPERLWAFVKFAIGATRKAITLQGDIVFSTSTPLTISIPGVFSSKFNKIPHVFEVRDLWPEVPIALGYLKGRFSQYLARKLEMFAYKNSARIVALAPGMADGIVSSGVDRKKVAIVPNGCDIELFKQQGSLSSESRNSPADVKMILYIGTIGEANGVSYIPRLAASLRNAESAFDVNFVVIGDGKFLGEVKQQAIDLGVDDRVKFLGALPKAEIPMWTSKCTATIMTYDGPEVLYRDSVSNKFFDSMASGKPVVANFSGFSTLIAKAKGAGVILPKSDFDVAARMLLDVLSDEEFFKTSAARCFDLADNVFNRTYQARLLESVFQAAFDDAELSDSIVGGEYYELWEAARNGES